MKIKFLAFVILSFFLTLSCSNRISQQREDRISIYNKNPYYFAYKGNPILLLGGSDEDNLFNHPRLMMQNLETLTKVGGNYIRCTMSSRDSGNVWPFAQNSDGKYDLEKFNPEYWQRFENCLREALARDIIVQVEVWATFDFYRDNWLANPFNPANNVNYSTQNTQLKSEWPFHPWRNTQPFFFSVPQKNNDSILLTYQQKFVDKLLSISFKYGNVLYCMDNETRAPAEWPWYWAQHILDKARKAGVSVLITEMWDAHDLHNEEHARTFKRPDLFAFFDISQNNWQEGQKHYDNALWARKAVAENGGARPLTNIKVYHRRQGRQPNDPLIGLDRWWRNIFAGCAGTRFHRPNSGAGLSDMARREIKAARVFTNAFDIFSTEPHPELLTDRQANEAYCLADPGNVYAVYFPRGGSVTLSIDNPNIRMQENWFDPETAEFLDARTIMSETSVTLTSPDTSQTWLVLVNNP